MKGRKFQIEQLRKRAAYQLQKSDVLDITYEEITDGNESVSAMPARAAEKICSFLGVEAAPLTTRMVKVAPNQVRMIT